jgi:hypothetical protein
LQGWSEILLPQLCRRGLWCCCEFTIKKRICFQPLKPGTYCLLLSAQDLLQSCRERMQLMPGFYITAAHSAGLHGPVNCQVYIPTHLCYCHTAPSYHHMLSALPLYILGVITVFRNFVSVITYTCHAAAPTHLCRLRLQPYTITCYMSSCWCKRVRGWTCRSAHWCFRQHQQAPQCRPASLLLLAWQHLLLTSQLEAMLHQHYSRCLAQWQCQCCLAQLLCMW